jgi:hypothetical protein
LAASSAVSALIDAYPTNLALVEVHLLDSYSTPFGDERRSFYGIGTIPDMRYDGGATVHSADYETALVARQAVPTDVTIDLTGVEAGAQTYDFTAHVCVEAGGVGKTVRVYMAQALDHWPVVPPFVTRNTLREGVVVGDVALSAGQCADLTHTFAFDATSWAQQSDIRVVAWAQEPYAVAPAEVHQARIIAWPFAPLEEIFADGFESGDTGAWSAVGP